MAPRAGAPGGAPPTLTPRGTPVQAQPAPAATTAPPPPGPSRGLSAPEVTADAAIAAGLPQEGALGAPSGLRLFALCASTGASGRLTLAPAGKAYALTFRKGGLEHAASSAAEDDLARFLLFRGAVTSEQVAQAEAAKAQTGGDVVAALVTLRLVNPGDIVRWLAEHGAQLVTRALGVEQGRWRWEPGVAPPQGSFTLGSPWTLLGNAVRALDPASVLRRLGEREQLGAARVGGRVRPEDLRLTAQESRAAAQLDGRRLADVARALPAEATTILRVALLLAEAELLAFGPPREGAAPPPPAPAPAAAPAAPPPPSAAPQAAAPSRPPAPAPVAAPRPAPAAAAPKPAPPRPPPPRPAPAPVAAPAAHAAAAPALTPAALQALLAMLHAKETDHFQVLGVKQDATASQIKVAYFQLAKAYHPDTVPASAPPEVKKLCADVFSRISEAWGVLGDEAQRQKYLDDLKTGAGVDVDVMNILQAENVFQAGTLLVKARSYAEAVPRFDEAIRLNPEEAEFGMWKAWCEFLLAQDKKRVHGAAAATIEAGLKKNARCAQGYLFLGQMAKITGDLATAEKQLKRGLGVAPDNADLIRELKYLRK